MNSASKSPLGIIVDPREPTELICYGTISGQLQAIRFGSGQLLDLTPELLAAIEADKLKSTR